MFKSFYIDKKLCKFYRDVLPKVTEEKSEHFISVFCLLAAVKVRANFPVEIRGLQCTSFGPQLRSAVLRSVVYCRVGCNSSLFQIICVLTQNCCVCLHSRQLFLSHRNRKLFHLCIRHQRVNFL